jgi:hypothetical protein
MPVSERRVRRQIAASLPCKLRWLDAWRVGQTLLGRKIVSSTGETDLNINKKE